MQRTRGVERTVAGLLFLALGLCSGCGEEGRTGIWLRVSSPEILLDKIALEVFDAESAEPTAAAEQEIFLPAPENADLWVLLFAGEVYATRAIRVQGTGFRAEREVAHGQLPRLEFERGAIIDAVPVLVLTHDGSDDDQDGFYVPDDCDDQDPAINPEATEFCDDLDNDCDGTRDEDCPCSPGLERECWPQWAAEPVPGSPCVKGLQRCEPQGWGACAGMLLPVPERCPGDAVDCYLCLDTEDNDCDGFFDAKDTGCGGCVVGSWNRCYTGEPPTTENVGVCHAGQMRCEDGSYGPCEDEVTPSDEVCDGRDNDCDGENDDPPVTTGPCTLFQGVCSGAQQRCVGGLPVDCTPEDYEQHARARLCLGQAGDPACCTDDQLDCYDLEETGALCDGQDNDCNGVPDDAVDGQCECSVGSTQPCPATPTGDPDQGDCQAGLWVCVDGQFQMDADCIPPAVELCDAQDNDCDGVSDMSLEAGADCLAALEAAGKTVSYHAVLSGCSQGVCRFTCLQGYWDLQQDRSVAPAGLATADGCEYACTLSTPLVERCDTLDNDCDGLTDGDDAAEALGTLCPDRAHATVTACAASACDYACAVPYEDCNTDLHDPVPLDLANETSDGCEINLSADMAHCGACGHACTTAHAEVLCENFVCVIQTCVGTWGDCNDDPEDACETPLNTLEDCVACDQICALDHATESCATGLECRISECDGGWGNCNGLHPDGCETDTTITLAHCGSCDHACLNDHGSTQCLASACAPSCDTDYGDCNGQTDDGCEADLWQLTSCGTVCANRVNCSQQVQNASGTLCASGTCDYGACLTGFGSCDGQRPNGCETSLWQAGACGTTCQNLLNCNTQVVHATGISCASGACDFNQCEVGWGSCDGDDTDGCEENLWQTTLCGNACAGRLNCNSTVVNATGINCAGGLCDFGACNSGWGSCDGDDTDGCEENIWQQTSCGTTCATRVNCTNTVQHSPNPACVNGLCDFTSCDAGYMSCDANDTNGCEEFIWDVAECGLACAGRVNCNTQVLNATGKTCASGACDYSACSTSQYADCDVNRTNGCERDKWQVANCGTTCAAGANCTTSVQHATGITCASGACDYTSCNSGWGNCDTNRTNGCEEGIWETADCGTTCLNRVNCTAQVLHSPDPSCASGLCDFTTCDAGYRSCDGDDTDGCEEGIWETADCGTTCGNRVDCNSQVLNATGKTCDQGACDYGACSSSRYGDCDGDRTDGCEADLYTLTSCGTNCGNRVNCSATVLNATGVSCASGTCDYESCNAGYGDCDLNRANGCEVDLNAPATCGLTCAGRVNCTTSVQHASGITCTTGVCGYTTCNPGYGNCDGDATDGCEEDIWDPANCGTTCTTVDCSATVDNATGLTCASGTCGYTACVAGFDDCDGDPTDGCEVDLDAITTCGTTCLNFRNCTTYTANANGRFCNAGTCDYTTCMANYDDCNPNRADGCERSLALATSCGSCTNNCTDDSYDKACVDDGGYRCGCTNDAHCNPGDTAHDICNTGQNYCQ
ncbi:MAG TPA: putative metal-binding motif-containing protein [Myxococcota bacterium]|nr:putative metal-binding motif-containing protein [Myxococcota bacterium]HRY96752.1 putative metal-binding motif-containing protein [Myxococcota bacterium]